MRFEFFFEWLNWLWVFAVRFWKNKQNGPTITSHDNGDSISVLHSPAPSSAKVLAVRFQKNRQKDTTITSHDSSDSIPVLHSPAYGVSARIEQDATPRVSDMVRLALGRVQDIAGSTSPVDSPLRAAINGMLTILQTIDRHTQNKAAIASLTRRLHRLWRYLCNVPFAHTGSEQCRRGDLISLLQGTSDQLIKLDNEGLGCQSVREALEKFSTELDQYQAEYTLATTQNYPVEIHTQLQQLRGSAAMDLPGTVIRHCIILVDATGYEHKIPMEFCMSLQQFKKMLNVLFTPDTDMACIQRQYLEQGEYDLCIDQGTQITELRSETDGWSSIEAGTKVVMRVIVRKDVSATSPIKCDGCGYSNFSVESADVGRGDYWTISCRECKRRYQISNPALTRAKGGVTRKSTDPAMIHLVRNIHVQEDFIQSIRFIRFIIIRRFRIRRQQTFKSLSLQSAQNPLCS